MEILERENREKKKRKEMRKVTGKIKQENFPELKNLSLQIDI